MRAFDYFDFNAFRGRFKVIGFLPYAAVMLLVLTGLFALLFKKNLIKIAMGVSIMGSGINLFLIALGYRDGGIAPIFTNSPGGEMVLPAPQALTLTSIVISLAVTALMLSLAIVLFRHFGSLDGQKRGEEK